jgi:hypothetical protein
MIITRGNEARLRNRVGQPERQDDPILVWDLRFAGLVSHRALVVADPGVENQTLDHSRRIVSTRRKEHRVTEVKVDR